MILDRGHLRWAVFSGVVLAASAAWYIVYAGGRPGGPSGSTFQGLTFGIVGTLFILFAALLGVRRRRAHWRLGRASTWLKGHLWLGALSLPLILFHGGFRFGGPLTQVLMWLFLFVFLTGVYGLALQQFLPRLMMQNVPQETVYEQIDHVRTQLLEEARQLASGGAGGSVAKAKRGGVIQGRVVKVRAAADGGGEEGEQGPDRAPLVQFVERYMRKYFERYGPAASELHQPRSRAALFAELCSTLAPELHPVAGDLEALCEQREQLELQRRMHHWLHGWLLIHVPCAWTMVLLTSVHAVMALYY